MPYDWLAEEEKIRDWFTDGFAVLSGATWKWTAAILQPLSGSTLAKGNLHSGQDFG